MIDNLNEKKTLLEDIGRNAKNSSMGTEDA